MILRGGFDENFDQRTLRLDHHDGIGCPIWRRANLFKEHCGKASAFRALFGAVDRSVRNSGLVKSIRGAYGGYILAKKPEQISAGDVIRVLEGPISPVDFTEEDDPAKRDLWIRIRDSIASVLDTTTLLHLIQYEDQGQHKDNYMFYI